ncbi:MAG: DUF4123 domain-containing protein [Rhodobacteraceae bacterium]|jgi:hypothetical protein|nr:DUF4123 domain-containing protein [Paracoccaceae bacterium]
MTAIGELPGAVAGRTAVVLGPARPLGPDDRGAVPEGMIPWLFPGDGRETYALLDAALIPGLPDMLEASGLAFRCLYLSDLAEELRDRAPYLVRLPPDHGLTRRLFTEATPPAGLWAEDCGIFVLSALPIEALVAHFRRFTRVEVSGGKRMFLRFWSAPVMSAFALHNEPDPLIEALLAPATLIYRDASSVAGPRLVALSAGEAG